MLEKLKAKKLEPAEVHAMTTLAADTIRKRCHFVTRIFLFGSAARNEMTDFSDIDLIVTVPNETDVRPARKLLSNLFCDVKWSIDLLIYDDADFDRRSHLGGVCFEVRMEGKLL